MLILANYTVCCDNIQRVHHCYILLTYVHDLHVYIHVYISLVCTTSIVQHR